VTDEKKEKRGADPDLDSGWDFDEEDGDGPLASGRPTLAPPFDLATYAKEAMVPSGGQSPSGPAAPPQTDAAMVANAAVSLPPPPALPRASAFPPRLVPGPTSDIPASTPAALELDFSDANPTTVPPLPPPVGAPSAAPTPASPARQAGHAGHGPKRRATRDDLAKISTIMTPLPPSSGPPSQRITPRDVAKLDAALIQARMAGAVPKEASGDNLLALANHRAPLLTPLRVPATASPTPSAPELSRESQPAVADPTVEMQERFALGDYSGALVMAESMLDENPTHVEAREYAESCRSVLQQMYTARIGPLDRVPIVEVAPDQLRWLSIDHRTGFILSLVDGVSSLEMILDVSGMPPLDALRMLFELVQQRIISVRDD
jgi:hypothetical protein